MRSNTTQELFLLEFLVDKVNIPSVQAIHDDVLPVTTCIEFRILNLPPIYISQDAAHENCTCLGEEPQIFHKGKSCLFGLAQSLLAGPICSFPVTMSVYKKLPATVLPDVMTIGCCQIELREALHCLMQECPDSLGQPCKTLKNRFRISTATGQCVGEVGLFLRLTRLGRKVVTQFQNPRQRKPYLFKGSVDSPVFQCRRVPSQLPEDPLQKCACPAPECEEMPPQPKSCCQPQMAQPAPRQRCSSKRKKSKHSADKAGEPRPCCPKKETGCQSSSHKRDEHSQPKTRQCGCDVKEDKPFSCGK